MYTEDKLPFRNHAQAQEKQMIDYKKKYLYAGTELSEHLIDEAIELARTAAYEKNGAVGAPSQLSNTPFYLADQAFVDANDYSLYGAAGAFKIGGKSGHLFVILMKYNPVPIEEYPAEDREFILKERNLQEDLFSHK